MSCMCSGAHACGAPGHQAICAQVPCTSAEEQQGNATTLPARHDLTHRKEEPETHDLTHSNEEEDTHTT
jgi:hypothetical protein